MKQFYKFIMSAMIFMYRHTNGSFGGSVAGLPVLLLTTIGRKSGLQRTTPLGFFEDDGNYIISASNAGGDTNPAWFANLQANPKVTLEIKRRHLTAVAEIAAPADRNRLWARLVELAPRYATYQQQTSREIPLIILHPEK